MIVLINNITVNYTTELIFFLLLLFTFTFKQVNATRSTRIYPRTYIFFKLIITKNIPKLYNLTLFYYAIIKNNYYRPTFNVYFLNYICFIAIKFKKTMVIINNKCSLFWSVPTFYRCIML